MAARGAAVVAMLSAACAPRPIRAARPAPLRPAIETPAARSPGRESVSPVASAVDAGQRPSQPSLAERDALNVSRALERMKLGFVGSMRVKGFVVALEDCSGCERGAPCPSCPLSYVQIADIRFPAERDRLMVADFPDADMPSLSLGQYLVVSGTPVSEFRGGVRPLSGHGLHHEAHAIAPAPARVSKPTYPDGSWSIAAVFERTDLAEGDVVRVTGTVDRVYRCPPCPPRALCKPCDRPHLIVIEPGMPGDEGLVVAGIEASPAKGGPSAELVEGRRYRIEGRVAFTVDGLRPKRGVALVYVRHEPAP